MTEIATARTGAVLELKLDRAKKKNALTFAMYGALTEALQAAKADGTVKAVVIAGAGDAFCAGNDIADFASGGVMDPVTAPPMRFLEALITFEKPVVAAVQGAAVGIGATMLLHVDLVIAAATTKFSVPFVGLGLVPEAASSLLLPARFGHAVASDLLLRGAVLGAERGRELGLFNEVVPSAEEALALAQARAQELAKMPPRALRATKALIRGDQAVVLQRLRDEAVLFAQAVSSEEAREAFAAFLERRPPDFTRFT